MVRQVAADRCDDPLQIDLKSTSAWRHPWGPGSRVTKQDRYDHGQPASLHAKRKQVYLCRRLRIGIPQRQEQVQYQIKRKGNMHPVEANGMRASDLGSISDAQFP